MRLKSLVQSYILSGSSLFAKMNVSFITPTGGQSTKVTPTYGPTITIDCSLGDNFIIAVSNNTAFTISAPTNAPSTGFTKKITITIANGSGGAMGAITWNAAFALAGAFTNPASTKQRSVTFLWSGTGWNELYRTAADVTTV